MPLATHILNNYFFPCLVQHQNNLPMHPVGSGFKIAEMRLLVEAFTSIAPRPLLRASLSVPSLFHPFHAGLPSALPSGELHRRFHPSTGRVPDRATWSRVARARLLPDGHCASILCRRRSRMAGA